MRIIKNHFGVSWVGALVWVCLVLSGAQASENIDPTNKYAWTENTGWVSAAPTNGGVTVHFDGTSGFLTGLAWGENIGWIKLGADSGGPYANTSAADALKSDAITGAPLKFFTPFIIAHGPSKRILAPILLSSLI